MTRRKTHQFLPIQFDGRLPCQACRKLLTVEEFVATPHCVPPAPPPTLEEMLAYLDQRGIPKATTQERP